MVSINNENKIETLGNQFLKNSVLMVLGFSLASTLLFPFHNASAESLALCQLKNEGKQYNATTRVQAVKLLPNGTCPKGFRLIGLIPSTSDVKQIIADNSLVLKGATGSVGPMGPQGSKGDTGDVGPQGLKGATGANGRDASATEVAVALKADNAFITLTKGATGAKGDAGIQGIQGIQGIKGDTGAQGLAGIAGSQGPTGPQGVKGDKGDRGDAGSAGETGARGANGAQGIQGLPGAAGPAGAVGAMGPQGPTGPTGPQGIQGLRGETGLVGATGAQGATGPAGATGRDASATEVAVALRSDNAFITLTKGATGATGASGAPGATGPQGAVGPMGPIGPKGDTGPVPTLPMAPASMMRASIPAAQILSNISATGSYNTSSSAVAIPANIRFVQLSSFCNIGGHSGTWGGAAMARVQFLDAGGNPIMKHVACSVSGGSQSNGTIGNGQINVPNDSDNSVIDANALEDLKTDYVPVPQNAVSVRLEIRGIRRAGNTRPSSYIAVQFMNQDILQ